MDDEKTVLIPDPRQRIPVALLVASSGVLLIAAACALAFLGWKYALGPYFAERIAQRCQCAVNDFTLEKYPRPEEAEPEVFLEPDSAQP